MASPCLATRKGKAVRAHCHLLEMPQGGHKHPIHSLLGPWRVQDAYAMGGEWLFIDTTGR